MVSIGLGAGQLVQNEFQTSAPTSSSSLPASSQTAGVRQGTVTTLTAADAHAIAAECPAVLAVLAVHRHQRPGHRRQHQLAARPDARRRPRLSARAQLAAGSTASSSATATSPGRPRCASSATRWSRSCSPDADPIGQQVRVKNIPFRVIGVLDRKGANLVGQDQDNIIVMPYTTVRKRLQTSAFANVDVVFVVRAERRPVAAGRTGDPQPADRAPSHPARRESPISRSATRPRSPTSSASSRASMTAMLSADRGHFADRRRRRHHEHHAGVGDRAHARDRHPHGPRARSRDILRQFLVEAVVLSSIGGVIGIALGIAASVGARI